MHAGMTSYHNIYILHGIKIISLHFKFYFTVKSKAITALVTNSSGAGKTTTFNMLTGDIRPTSGTATIAGYDIISDIRKVV